MVVKDQAARQLSLGLFPSTTVPIRPEPMRAPAPILNSAQLRMETEEFLLSKMNSAFNSFLSLFEKANPECAKDFRAELCRIFCARIEGGKAILEKIPSESQMREAGPLIHGLRYSSLDFRKGRAEGHWKWRAVSEEEQNISYSLERASAMNLISGLQSLLEKREYGDFILVLDLCQKQAIECARKPRTYGKPKVSGYEVLLCNDLQNVISGKVGQLAETEKN